MSERKHWCDWGLARDQCETRRLQLWSSGVIMTHCSALGLNRFARRGLTDLCISSIVIAQMRTAPTTRLKGESVLFASKPNRAIVAIALN